MRKYGFSRLWELNRGYLKLEWLTSLLSDASLKTRLRSLLSRSTANCIIGDAGIDTLALFRLRTLFPWYILLLFRSLLGSSWVVWSTTGWCIRVLPFSVYICYSISNTGRKNLSYLRTWISFCWDEARWIHSVCAFVLLLYHWGLLAIMIGALPI